MEKSSVGNKSLKSECIRPGTPLSLKDARRLIESYVEYYNNTRLNSAIGYVTPKDMLAGRQHEIHAERDRKLAEARQHVRVVANKLRECSCRMSTSAIAMNGIFATGFSGAVRGRRALPDFTLERLLYRAGQVVPAHYHAEPAVILLVSGHCTLRNDFRCDLPCAPGAAIVHPAGEQHSYRYEADRESQMLAITLPIRSCERFRSPLDLERPRLAHDPEIAPLMARLRHRVQQPHTSALSLAATVFELLGQLCGSCKESSLTPSLARVRDLLHSRFKEPLSLTEIARSTDLSPIQLARHFRRQFGCSPAAYIRKLRLDYACERLASSSLPIVDLAHELGFFDQSHFCHTFGKHFGVSPVAYRSNTGRH